MPMTYTDDMVVNLLERRGLPTALNPAEARERLASYVEDRYQDFVDAWEIRTGRPWNTMTPAEAEELVARHPETARNPGVLSRLLR